MDDNCNESSQWQTQGLGDTASEILWVSNKQSAGEPGQKPALTLLWGGDWTKYLNHPEGDYGLRHLAL